MVGERTRRGRGSWLKSDNKGNQTIAKGCGMFLRVCVCVSFVLDWVFFGSGLGETHARGLSHTARLSNDLPLRHDLMLIRFTSGFVFILRLYDSSMDTVQRTARTPSLFIAFLALFNKKDLALSHPAVPNGNLSRLYWYPPSTPSGLYRITAL